MLDSHIVDHTIRIGAILNNPFIISGAKLHIALANSFHFNQSVILSTARQLIYLTLNDSKNCFTLSVSFVNVHFTIAIHSCSFVLVICCNCSILFVK